jgi:hypothetical protein
LPKLWQHTLGGDKKGIFLFFFCWIQDFTLLIGFYTVKRALLFGPRAFCSFIRYSLSHSLLSGKGQCDVAGLLTIFSVFFKSMAIVIGIFFIDFFVCSSFISAAGNDKESCDDI